MKTTIKPETDERKSTHMDFQFVVAVYYPREVYLNDKTKATHLYSEWGGVEFGNSWKAAIRNAEEIVAKNPEYLCVVIDRYNRKKPFEI